MDQYFDTLGNVRDPHVAPESTQEGRLCLTSDAQVRVLQGLLGDITNIRHALAYSDAAITSATLLIVYEGNHVESSAKEIHGADQQPQDDDRIRKEEVGDSSGHSSKQDDLLYTVRLMNFGFAPHTEPNVEGQSSRARISHDRLDRLGEALQRRLKKFSPSTNPDLYR